MKQGASGSHVAIVAAFAAFSVAMGCSRARNDDGAPTLATVAAPAKARRERVTSETFAAMVRLDTPLRAPSSDDGRIRIVTYLELAPGALVDLDGETLAGLVVPAGSFAARVEYLAPEGTAKDAPPAGSWRVLDVRATRFEPSGEVYSVARPSPSGGHVWVTWPKAEHVQGTVALLDLARAGMFGGGDDAQRIHLAQKLGAINDCPSCHAPRSAPSPSGERALVKRGTDTSGLYSLLSVLRDEGPIETYRPRDMNAGDELVEVRCVTGDSGAVRAPCPGGLAPTAHYRLAEGIARGDGHANAVCAARQTLARHMTPRARSAVAVALAPCGP